VKITPKPYKYDISSIPAEGILISVTDGDAEMGRAIMYILTNPNRGRKYGILSDVRLEPQYRGKGVGTELIQKTIDVAKEAGCYKVLADSRFEREYVHRLYEKFGFNKHGYEFRMEFEPVEEQK
jgi:GNAT superfamily N-acetyltransferase